MTNGEHQPGTDLALGDATETEIDVPARPEPAANRLASEEVIIAAPMSFTGSAQRLWRITRSANTTPAKIALGTMTVLIIGVAWTVILCWYVFFGIWLVPYRMLRRGSRKRKRQALQHREMLDAIEKKTV